MGNRSLDLDIIGVGTPYARRENGHLVPGRLKVAADTGAVSFVPVEGQTLTPEDQEPQEASEGVTEPS